MLQGYLPHRWPKWWQPEFIRFEPRPFGPFEEAMPLTRRGDVLIVPTPGHTPHHVSVVVCGDPSFLLAGDTSYNQSLLLAGKVDGVSPDPRVTRRTLARILALAQRTAAGLSAVPRPRLGNPARGSSGSGREGARFVGRSSDGGGAPARSSMKGLGRRRTSP